MAAASRLFLTSVSDLGMGYPGTWFLFLAGRKGGFGGFQQDLADLLSGLDIEKAILCGLSLGGHISPQTAVRYPEKVAPWY